MILVMTATIQMPIPSLVAESPRPFKWSRDEYYRLADAGLLAGHRVQLIDGEIIEMSPHGGSHALVITLVQEALLSAFPKSHVIRVQLPISIPSRSEPEPDVAVVPGRPRDFPTAPHSAILVVEVGDSSLELDLGPKAALYASAGIADYWVIDILGRRAIVHRQPIADAGVALGHRYADIRTLAATDKIAPLARPDATIDIADLLP